MCIVSVTLATSAEIPSELQSLAYLVKSYSLGGEMESRLQNQNIPGLVKLCIDSQPDGATIVSSDHGEVMMVFKVKHFWVFDVEYFISNIMNLSSPEDHRIFSDQNQMLASSVWPDFMISPNYVLSFLDLNPKDTFYNNVLMFRENSLKRYRLDQLSKSGPDKWTIRTTLISSHITDYWYSFPQAVSDIMILTIPRNTTNVYVERNHFLKTSPALYSLNDENIDDPVHFGTSGGAIIPYLNKARSTLISYNSFKDKIIYFTSGGDVCIMDDCVALRLSIICDPHINAFIESSAYRLWGQTGLNIRLIIVAICSVMTINFFLAISFVAHQIQRIADLS